MFPSELGVMLMQYKVTTQIDGKDVLAGTLYQNVRYGQETASFSYDSSYLENPKAFSLAPDMPLGSGAFHSEGLKEFRALEDCMPDRWGRNLLFRAERSRAYREMARALQSWRSKAHKQGISKASIDKMASCFDGGIEKLLVAAKR